MLDLGFREDLEFILSEAPEERQTLLFSATVPNTITHLAKSYQRDAIRVVTKSEEGQHADIEYRAMLVAERDADNAVINTLRFYEAPNAIVFANTRAMVNRLTTRLSNRGFQVVALSGELSQAERTHALQAMRDGRAQVCVATDVAARGIDLPNLDLVVHAELPSNHETLLHRSGRTGRAGRKGVSALIVTNKSRKKAERVLRWAKLAAEWTGAPSAEQVLARDEERMLADPVWQEPAQDSDGPTIEKLVAQFSPEQIATAYVSLYRAAHTAPEELSNMDAKPMPRKEFGPSVWFSLTGGRAAHAEPRRILPMLCKAGDLSKDDIGAIRIQQTESFFQIREGSVDRFLKALGSDMTVEGNAVVAQLAEAPTFDHAPRPGGKGPGKPHHRGKRPEKPSFDKPSPKAPAPKKPSSAPIDWNDDPAPRQKKPKSSDKPQGKKPRHSDETKRKNDGGYGPAQTAQTQRQAQRPTPAQGQAQQQEEQGARCGGQGGPKRREQTLGGVACRPGGLRDELQQPGGMAVSAQGFFADRNESQRLWHAHVRGGFAINHHRRVMHLAGFLQALGAVDRIADVDHLRLFPSRFAHRDMSA